MSIILVGTSLPFEWDNLSPLVRIEFTNLPKFGEDQSTVVHLTNRVGTLGYDAVPPL